MSVYITRDEIEQQVSPPMVKLVIDDCFRGMDLRADYSGFTKPELDLFNMGHYYIDEPTHTKQDKTKIK